MEKIVLANPILIDGISVNELTYDTDEITALQFAEADNKRSKVSGAKNGNLSAAAEFDYSLHLYLGFAAVIAVNPSYAIADLERIKGKDLMKVMKIGRNFTLGVENLQENDSDEALEIIQEPSTPQLQSSKEKES